MQPAAETTDDFFPRTEGGLWLSSTVALSALQLTSYIAPHASLCCCRRRRCCCYVGGIILSCGGEETFREVDGGGGDAVLNVGGRRPHRRRIRSDNWRRAPRSLPSRRSARLPQHQQQQQPHQLCGSLGISGGWDFAHHCDARVPLVPKINAGLKL